MARTRPTVARDLDSEQRADVRFSCGFGCMRCGATIYVYVYIPRSENPVLLCPTCLDLAEKDRIGTDQLLVLAAAPVLRDPAFRRDHLPFSPRVPILHLGGARPLVDTPVPIRVDGVAPLMFAPPRRGIGAVRISLRLGDAGGDAVTLIDNNEYLGGPDWRYAWTGRRMTISASDTDAALTLRFDSRTDIVVEMLRTRVGARHLVITDTAMDIDGQALPDLFANGALVGLEL